MKKSFLLTLLFSFLLVVSCKDNAAQKETTSANSVSEETENNLPTYQGEFFYSAEGAVLKGNNFIYAVTLDDMAKKLGEQVAPIKNEDFDMVPVSVKGIVERNPALDEGKQVWEQIITIKEIISVSTTPAEVDIKIEDTKS